MDESLLNSINILCNRFNEFAFFNLSFERFSFRESTLKEKKEIRDFSKNLSLENKNHLFLLGISIDFFSSQILSWLEKEENHLIILEDSKSEFFTFLKSKEAENILKNEKIKFHFLFKKNEEEIEKIASLYPRAKPHIAILPGREKDPFFKETEEKLKFCLALEEAFFLERFHSDVFFHQTIENIKKLPSSYSFNLLKERFINIPAVICGAGPSLFESRNFIKEIENRALIFAGGSAIPLLSSYNIFFHIAGAIDPNLEEYKRLKESSSFDSLLLFFLRMQKDISNLFFSPLFYVKSYFGGLLEGYLDQKIHLDGDFFGIDLPKEALSIATLLLSIAKSLGCNPIFLTGVDLCFVNKKRYGKGKDFKGSSNLLVESKSFFQKGGKNIETNLGFLMEARAIENFLKKNKELEVFSLSKNALPIEGLKQISKKNAFAHLYKSFDLKALLHYELQTSCSKSPSKEKIEEFLVMLKESLLRMKKALSFFPKEPSFGEIVLLEELLKKEEIFKVLFFEYFFHKPEKKREKYQFLLKVIDRYLKEFCM